MTWTIIFVVIIIICIASYKNSNETSLDLNGQSFPEKVKFTVASLNSFAFDGMGSMTIHSKKEFNLYKIGSNQIILFTYYSGQLTILWKYKFFQKEIEHSKVFKDVSNLSVFEQQEIGKIMIREMTVIIAQHKNKIIPSFNQFPLENKEYNGVDEKLELLCSLAKSQRLTTKTASLIESELDDLVQLFSKNDLSQLQITKTANILEIYTLVANDNKIILSGSENDFLARYTVYLYFFTELKNKDKYLTMKSLMPWASQMHPAPNRLLISRITNLDKLVENKTSMSFKLYCLGT